MKKAKTILKNSRLQRSTICDWADLEREEEDLLEMVIKVLQKILSSPDAILSKHNWVPDKEENAAFVALEPGRNSSEMKRKTYDQKIFISFLNNRTNMKTPNEGRD